MKKIGLMGCGAVARYGHIPALLATEGVELHALFDPHEASLKAAQAQFGIARGFTDPTAFFESGLDAVSVTSPAPCHRGNVLDAAARHLPALCEKPLATSEAEGLEMVEAMRAAGAPLHTAFCYRFSPAALKIRELVRSRAIGDVRSLRLIYNWSLHGKYAIDEAGRRHIQKRREDRMFEGGPMVDCGTHQIDLARFWTGSEIIGHAAHGAWVDDYEAPDHMWLHLDHANGEHTVVEISYSYHHTAKNQQSEFLYELIGKDGVIRYERESERFWLENGDGRQTFDYSPEKNFEGLYAEWARFLVTGKSELLTSAADGLRVAAIAREATDAVIAERRARKRPAPAGRA